MHGNGERERIMKHEILGADGIRDDLRERIVSRSRALDRILHNTTTSGYSAPESSLLASAADRLTNVLQERDAGRAAATLIVGELTERAERQTTAFWSSPTGRACGWWLGGIETAPRKGVPLVIVAAILGMSRQAVHEARNAGRFGDDRTIVTPGGVSEWMRKTYPLEVLSSG